MIKMDTEQLNSLVQQLETACSQLDQAESSLLRVAEHRDWGCKGSEYINEQVRTLRKKMQQLQDDGANFRNAARVTAADFCDAEREMIAWGNELDSVVANAADAVPIAGKIGVIRAKIPNVADIVKAWERMYPKMTCPGMGVGVGSIASIDLTDLYL